MISLRFISRGLGFQPDRLLWLLCLLIGASGIRASAQSPDAAFDAANKLHEQGKFTEAASAYEKLLETGHVSEALYFNLGNALFKSGKIGRAIAAYLQAERLAPRDPDVRTNLQFARNRVQGPTLLPDAVSRWLGKLRLDEWAWLAAACVWAWLLLLAWMQLRPALRPALGSYGVWLGAIAAVICALCGADWYENRMVWRAIVIVPEASARQAPLEESQGVVTLHDGAELKVLDQKDQWLQVQLDSRRTGWINREAVKTDAPPGATKQHD